MDVLAIIPARSGSKSILNKNLRLLAGLPLIAHSIIHSKKSKLISRTIVSTDSEEIASISRNYGAETPFLRPRDIADDLSRDYEYVKHALDWLSAKEDYKPEVIVQLRPTTPIRNIDMIDKAISFFMDNPNADSLRAIVEVKFSPYKMWTLKEGFLEPIIKSEIYEAYNAPRQILPIIYQQDGFIDIVRRSTIYVKKSITCDKILPFQINSESIDIDYESELNDANLILNSEKKNG